MNSYVKLDIEGQENKNLASIQSNTSAVDLSISSKLLVTPSSVGLVCQICNKLISNSSILKNHIQEVHEGFQQNKKI